MSESENAFSDDYDVLSSEFGPIETDSIQRVITAYENPGFIYLPSGTWEEHIIISQHNLTLVGEGEDTIIKNTREQPPITILAPVVRIINLTIQSEYDVPAVSLSHGDATQVVFQNVTISKSDGDGIHRDENYGFAVGAILNCRFRNIGGHAVHAPTGSGPRNIVIGNSGENIDGDFIRWGVDNSLIANNRCEDSSIHLTQDAHRNFILTSDETEVEPGYPEDNFVY